MENVNLGQRGINHIVKREGYTIWEGYPITLDFSPSVEELASSAIKDGLISSVSPEITNADFPTSLHGKRTVQFNGFHFRSRLSLEEMLTSMEKESCLPVDMQGLLLFPSCLSGLIKSISFVALGDGFPAGILEIEGCRGCPDINTILKTGIDSRRQIFLGMKFLP